jgi:histidinol-phosphate aminotransferase
LALAAIKEALTEVHRYPESDAHHLERQIAEFHALEPDQVLVAAGATELLSIVARLFVAPGLNAITSERSFLVYRLATQSSGGQLLEVPAHENTYDLEAILHSIDDNTRIVFIANPNNPTGTVVGADDLDRFLDRVPDHVLTVIDEAYGDFAAHFAAERHVPYSRAIERVRQGRRLLLVKTFSKAHGLAGLRIGYGLGPEGLVRLLASLRTMFSLSSLALAAAARALEDQGHMRKAVMNNTEQAAIVSRELEKLGFEIPPTWANFLYWELGHDALDFARRLEREGVRVQPLGSWGAPRAVRVTIGTPQENQTFLAAANSVAANR